MEIKVGSCLAKDVCIGDLGCIKYSLYLKRAMLDLEFLVERVLAVDGAVLRLQKRAQVVQRVASEPESRRHRLVDDVVVALRLVLANPRELAVLDEDLRQVPRHQ